MSNHPNPLRQVRLTDPLRVSRLTARKTYPITLAPDAAQRAQIAELLQIEALRKFRFDAELRPLGRTDWDLQGKLGATVVQLCAVTLAPVTTRIDEAVLRRFLADLPDPEGLEVEMPEDDTCEQLGAEIDISDIAIEALSLALPAFPRAPEAELSPNGVLQYGPPGAAPLAESRPKPFAGLAILKGKLEQGPKRSSGDEE